MNITHFFERVLPYIASFSILVPAISFFFSGRQIEDKYRPVFYWIFLKMVVELVATGIKIIYENEGISIHNARIILQVIHNFFVLFEMLLLFWMFYEFKNRRPLAKRVYGTLLAICLTVFVAETIYMESIKLLLSWYRIVVSFIFVFIAVDHINYLLVNERRVVWRSAEFLICFGLVLYFCYKLLVEIFTEYADDSIKPSIYTVQLFVIILFNIILLFAVLCLPRKQDITRYL